MAEGRRLLEARRIQPSITGENANILGALVARQAIDVSDDFIFFSALFDKSVRAVADIAEQMPGLAHRAELPRSLYQTLRHDHRIASLPVHVWQRALHVLQLGQRKPRPESIRPIFAFSKPFSLSSFAPSAPT